MAKLYFNYSAMNAGKSTVLLQASHNYRERGMDTLLLTARLDNRAGVGTIGSRIGLEARARTFSESDDLGAQIAEAHGEKPLACVLVDEAQFLTEQQVWQLARVADRRGVPVMCFGLRTDFQGKLFPGSASAAGHCGHLAGNSHDLLVRSQGHDGGAPRRGWQDHRGRGTGRDRR